MTPGVKITIAVCIVAGSMCQAFSANAVIKDSWPVTSAIVQVVGVGFLTLGTWLAPSPLDVSNRGRRREDKKKLDAGNFTG